jgi:hypothetical protein
MILPKKIKLYAPGLLCLIPAAIDARRAYCSSTPDGNNGSPVSWIKKLKDAMEAKTEDKAFQALYTDVSVGVAKMFEGGLPGEVLRFKKKYYSPLNS